MKKPSAIFSACLILSGVTFRPACGWVLSNHPSQPAHHRGLTGDHKQPPSIEEIRRTIKGAGFNFTVAETRAYRLQPGQSGELPGTAPCVIDEKRLKRSYPAHHLPSYFDWRDEDTVTPVKDQHPCQLCWAFTAVAQLESKIMRDEGIAYDLSEQHLASCDFAASAGKALSCSSGGSPFRATNFLTQRGAALESCAPFHALDGVSCNHQCGIVKNVDGWRMLAHDIDTIKDVLYKHGPVASSMDASDPAFRAYTGGVYEFYDSVMVNHAVLIVGWDDNLGPEGAWIVKNSWGTDWGMGGYGYVAYGAAKIGTMSSFISSYKDPDPAESLLYYDEGGFFCFDQEGACTGVGSIGAGRPTAWCAAVFLPPATGILKAVDFWTTSVNASYEIRVYGRIAGSSMKKLRTLKRGRCEELGYYSIPFSHPVRVKGGDDFVVAIRLTTPGYCYPIPVDITGPAERGRCYVSEDGKAWQAIGRGTTMPYDLAVRARVVGVAGHD